MKLIKTREREHVIYFHFETENGDRVTIEVSKNEEKIIINSGISGIPYVRPRTANEIEIKVME